MAAVPEVREAFALSNVAQPEAYLWANADGVVLQYLGSSSEYARPVYLLRGKAGLREISVLLVRNGSEFVAVPEDQDVVGCWSPICEGTNLLFDEERVACGNRSCPNWGRWLI
jgi:hypothetical protein